MGRFWWSIVAVWALAVAAVVILFAGPMREHALSGLGVAFAACVVLAVSLQLATQTPEGFVHRATLGIGGAFALFVVATPFALLFA